MGFTSLYTAATGMQAAEFKLDVTANNMANAGTTGFKRSRANFDDSFYRYFKLPGAQDSQGNQTAVGTHIGLGTQLASTQIDHSQGALLQTNGPLALAINGDGFFQIQQGTQTLYSRAGNFTKNANGQILVGSADLGRLLIPNFTIPQDALEISITGDGTVAVRQPGQTSLNNLGQIQLVKFINPQGLIQVGDNLYASSDASGQPVQGIPGQDGLGTLQQSFLEQSNAEPVQELVDLIHTQRNFELNSQVIQASDQQLQVVANIRRY